jgi:hypothetical protein
MELKRNRIYRMFAYGCIVLIISGCVAGKTGKETDTAGDKGASATQGITNAKKIELASMEEMTTGAPLKTAYSNVVLGTFKSSEQIHADYPEAVEDCEKHILSQLKSKNVYAHVTTSEAKRFSGKTVVVDFEVLDMRITSSSARMWGGVFAGKSYMEVQVKIQSVDRKELLHEKILTTSNNAWAAAYSGGSSDRNLPADLGMLIGEYLYKVIPAK